MRALCFVVSLTVIVSCSAPGDESKKRLESVDTSALSNAIHEVESPAGPLELSNDEFFVTWGTENHTGRSDLSAEASLWSDSVSINLVVRVQDDSLVMSDDVLHSDHVEVWFSASPAPMKYIVVTDTSTDSERLFHYKNTTNVDSFLAELEHPLFEYRTPAENSDENFRGRIDTTRRAQTYWREYGFQDAIDQLKKGTVEERYVFDGMVHWGLFPNGRDAFLYDQERYNVIEVHTEKDFAIADYAPVYTSTVTDEGTSFVHNFLPKAWGLWLPRGLVVLNL